MALQFLWILSAFGAAVFAATPVGGWRGIGALATGFAAAAILFRSGVPQTSAIGGLVALLAALRVFRPGWTFVSAVAGGFLAGIIAALLQFYGLAQVPALAIAATLPAIAWWCATRIPHFAPATMREEASLLTLVLGLAAAVGPAVADGWQSAGALNGSLAANVSQAIPLWVPMLSATSVILGGAWSLWRHR